MSPSPPAPSRNELSPSLDRRLGFWQATALNMSNMMGAGPFITIPLLMSALGGPQSMLGWLLALLVTIPDSMVWSELGAAMPGSGGSYRYLREGFGRTRWGRLVAFLFLWQFLISGPLEIASGYIGFAQYLDYLWPGVFNQSGRLSFRGGLIVIALGLGLIALLYRRIASIGKLSVALWVGVMVTVGWVLLTGAIHFDSRKAFDFPPDAFQFTWGFMLGLGAAARIGIYDFLGYYDVCYLGDEVVNPGRTIPRSIRTSLVVVALIYIGINLSINGIISWREFVPDTAHPEAKFIASTLMEKVYGKTAAQIFTVLILWTVFAGCFALMLGYSRIPLAAAIDGGFFRIFARLHPQGGFPHVSLLVIGLLSIFASFVSLDTVVGALVTLRIVLQFMGQIVALVILRRTQPNLNRPYRVGGYPWSLGLAMLGWLFLLVTNDPKLLLFAGLSLVVGVIAYLVWSRIQQIWPWEKP